MTIIGQHGFPASQCLTAPRAIGILSPECPMEICSVLMETGLVFSVMGQEHIALGAGKVINTSGLPISGRMLLRGSSNR